MRRRKGKTAAGALWAAATVCAAATTAARAQALRWNTTSGAWNTDQHWGGDFQQWTGSLLQKKGLDEIHRASEYYRRVKGAADESGAGGEVRGWVVEAYDHLLKAQTSCNFYWGSRWVHRSFDDLERTYRLLDQAMAKLGARSAS